MNTQTQLLSRELTNERIKMPFPNLTVMNPSNHMVVVLNVLEEGSLPVLCELNGEIRQVRTIRNSALAIDKLRQVCTLKYVKSREDVTQLNSVEDILEVLA